ncbi:MAG TPA: MFS transporter [Mycobacteriales bacterium]|nr:MFS transporter [Mycobacteriales bacterium]
MRKWLPLVAISLGTFMLLVDVTIVTVALPDMANSLSASLSDLQWVMDVYALALAALLLGSGTLADRSGRKRIYLVGLVVFALASLGCAVAPNPGLLVAARAVQGIGGAAMFATTLALLGVTYHGPDRAIAFGSWGAINGAASAIGPILGGLLTEHFGWRWIFLINLPVSVVAVALAARVLTESRAPQAGRIDLPGMASFAIAAGALTWALIRGGDTGWTAAPTLTLFAVAAAGLIAFVLLQQRSRQPMLQLALLRNPSFVGIMLAGAVLTGCAFAYLGFTSLWLQSVLGFGPVGAGLALVPLAIAAFVAAGASGRLLGDAPPRLTITAGLVLVGVGDLAESMLDAGSGRWALLPGLVIAGIGVGIAMPALSSAALSTVPPARAGMASGAVTTFRQLGFAFGIAVFGVLFANRITDHLPGVPAAGAIASGQAPAVLGQTPPSGRADLAQAIHAAFTAGLNLTTTVAGLTALAGAVAVAVLLRRPVAPAGQPASAEPDVAAARA